MARVLRASPGSHINLASILESQQIVVDLRIPDYEASTRKFLKAVSSYTNRAIEEITRRKNSYEQEIKRVSERKQQNEAETTACKVKEIKLMEGKAPTSAHLALLSLLIMYYLISPRGRTDGEKRCRVFCRRVEATIRVDQGQVCLGRCRNRTVPCGCRKFASRLATLTHNQSKAY